MGGGRVRPVSGRYDMWWLRPSIIRKRDLEAIVALVKCDDGYVITAGRTPDSVQTVTIDELFKLPPADRAYAYLSAQILMNLGFYYHREEPIGPWGADGNNDRPEPFIIPVNRYLVRHTWPRLPRHLAAHLLIPVLISVGAILAIVLGAIYAPGSPASLAGGVIAVLVALINERRRWRRESPTPPSHKLVP